MHDTAKIIIAVFLVVMVITFTACRSSSIRKRENKVYSYEASSEVLNNPLVGYAPCADSTSSVGDNSLVYIDILWSELEPEEGQFNFSEIDEKNNVSKWISEGKHAVLRFIADLPSEEKHMDIPQWLYDKIEGNGTFYNYDGSFGFSPDYNNPLLIQYHELAIRALGSHFGNSTFVSFVELGSLGHWGEWHVSYKDNITRMPVAKIRELYIKPYISAFPNAKIMMRRPFAAAGEHGFGLFDDMAGHPTDSEEWLGWIKNGGDYSQANEKGALVPMPRGWETAPIGGEFTSSFGMDYLLKFNLKTTKELIKRSHTSFLGPKCPTPSVIEKYNCGPQADEIKNLMGYRFRIIESKVKKTAVELTWTNDGIAPMYWNWDVFLFIYDENKELLSKAPVDIKLTGLLPGKTITTKTDIGNNLLDQKAKYICLGVVDPMTDRPAMKFGMTTEYIENTAVLMQIR